MTPNRLSVAARVGVPIAIALGGLGLAQVTHGGAMPIVAATVTMWVAFAAAKSSKSI